MIATTKQEITHLCRECGIAANVLEALKRFGRPPKKLSFDLSTFYLGVCDYCGEKKYITHVRDFFFPDTYLLTEVAHYFKHEK